MSMKWMRLACLGVMAWVPCSAIACLPPFNESFVSRGTVEWSGSGDDCALTATVDASQPVVSHAPRIAAVHYRRLEPTDPLRVSFRVTRPVAGSWPAYQGVTILRGTARGVPATGPDQAVVFAISLQGSPSGGVAKVAAACASNSSGVCNQSVPGLVFPLTITTEFTSGAGAAGSLHVWFGDDSSGPPHAALENLDNERWGGAERVTLGLLDSLSSLFPVTAAGNPTIFDRLSISDAWLFAGDFDLDATQFVVPNKPLIGEQMMTYLDNTCSGIGTLPVVASGSVAKLGYGPVNVYPFRWDSFNQRGIELQPINPGGAVALLCEAPLSPTTRCLSIVGEGERSPTSYERSRDYVVVVGRATECGSYALTVTGTLGF